MLITVNKLTGKTRQRHVSTLIKYGIYFDFNMLTSDNNKQYLNYKIKY